jgi:lipopolysaccharide transport system ATP-binding protein
MSSVIQVENVAKRYNLGELSRKTFLADWKRKIFGGDEPEDAAGVFWALRDVSFNIQQGEVVGILGRNGAGKSTLLKLLSSITSPTRGAIRLKGRIASLLEVGTGFHQELSGRDNVFLNGAILGMSRREVAAKFDEIVAFSGVEQFIDTPVKRYSSGMRVRLAFAVAAMLEAELLMIDEVLAVGDAAFQQKCLGKIGEVAGSGRTVLFVSHNAATVEALCRRGIVLKKGTVDFDGTQTDALRHYAEMNAAHGKSVRERTDRTGEGPLRLVEIEVKNDGGKTVKTVNAGDSIELWMHFENPGKTQHPQLNARINVQTQLGTPVFTQSNTLMGVAFGEIPEKGVFVCKIPKLPLPAGNYQVTVQISKSYRQAEMIDALENALELEVEAGNFFGTGILPGLVSGTALVSAEWHMEPDSRG